MASSKVCSIDTCKIPAQALCYCCQQALCSGHLKQHVDILNLELPSLAHELNALFEQFNNDSLVKTSFITELDKWHEETQRAIDGFYERKKQEYYECLEKQRTKQKMKFDQLRHEIDKLIQDQGATRENTCAIQNSLQSLQQQMDQTDSLSFTFSPLVINDQLITIDNHMIRSNDLLTLPSISQTINEKINFDCLAANDNYLSVLLKDHFCLLDRHLTVQQRIPWTHDHLWSTIWSKTLEQFLLITAEDIYAFDEKTMTIGQVPLIHNNKMTSWWCGTCSNDALFLSTMGRGVPVYEYLLRPTIKLVKEYQSPISCAQNEEIDDLSSNDHTLAIIIRSHETDSRVDLCSIKTLERLRSVSLGVSLEFRRIRSCSLFNNHWLIINPNDGLYQISTDGKFHKKENYNPIPRCAVLFANHFLAILAHESINLQSIAY